MWCSNPWDLRFKKAINTGFLEWQVSICNLIATLCHLPQSVLTSSEEFTKRNLSKKPENFDFFWNIHNLDNTTYNYDINMSVIVVIEMIAGCFFVDTVIIARILWVSLYHQPVQSIKSVIKAAYTQPIQQYLLFSIGIKNM